MFLAAEGKGCDGGLDLLGMFDDPIGGMIEMVAEIVINGAIGIFQAVGNIDSINHGASDKIGGATRWIVAYLACGSILVACIKMALERKGEAGTTALKGIVRTVVVATAATTLITTVVDLMERYYSYLFKNTLDNLMKGINCPGNAVIPDMLLLVIGCLLILAGIVHAILMWVRLGVMIMLMGTLPLAAAASMTDWGGTWWRKHLGWLIAWLLYKPTVALIMYSGAVMVDRSEDAATYTNADTQLAGMATLLLSAIALPALMRIIVPATAALGGDAVGDTVSGGVASGAKSLGDAGGGRSQGDGPSGSRGPSGASGGSGTSGGGGARGSAGASGGAGQAGKSAGAAGGGAAAAAGPAAVIAAAAAKTAGAVANVAKSGVEGADGEKGVGR